MNYEMVAGLETHVELSTKTKIFCGCTTRFGGEPNTNCCPVCIGLPGTLPKLNHQVVRYAIMAGLATNCKINSISKMDRKNYVYPDLPKAYQISQYDKPLCVGGYVILSSGRRINITRIHIEEDAGKLVHSRGDTFIDYNRGGVPLIEIVTEPDFRSIDECKEYLEKLQQLMRYIGVSDCKMQEGSLRCDVNISVRRQGEQKMGTRTEIKNMNSFTFMTKAVEYEFNRQVDLVESGEGVLQETRRYNEETGETESMRGKEDANDYRYFREPDLVTISTSEEEIEKIRQSLPELPDVLLERYTGGMGLPPADAQTLVKYRNVARYFSEAACGVKNPKTVANFIIGQVFRRFNSEAEKEECKVTVSAQNLKELVLLLESGKIRMNLAKSTLEKMLDTGKPVRELISEKDMAGIDETALKAMCEQAVSQNTNAVQDYLGGKEKALKALLGSVMKASRGSADAASVEKMLIEMLRNR